MPKGCWEMQSFAPHTALLKGNPRSNQKVLLYKRSLSQAQGLLMPFPCHWHGQHPEDEFLRLCFLDNKADGWQAWWGRAGRLRQVQPREMAGGNDHSRGSLWKPTPIPKQAD